jgi:hypothetical protein
MKLSLALFGVGVVAFYVGAHRLTAGDGVWWLAAGMALGIGSALRASRQV